MLLFENMNKTFIFVRFTQVRTEVIIECQPADRHDCNLQGAAFTSVCQISILVQCEIISVIWSSPLKVALCGDLIMVTVSQMHIWNKLYR